MGVLDSKHYDISQYVSNKSKMDSFNVSLYVNVDVSWVYENFRMRKGGIVKAFKTDYEDLYEKCKADRNGRYLYGCSDGKWELVRDAKRDLPSPSEQLFHCGKEKNLISWVMDVMNVSHDWLLRVADFHATEKGLDQLARKIIFNLICELPTVSDVATGVLQDFDDVAMKRKGYGKLLMIECKGCSGNDRQDDAWVECGKCKHNYHPRCISGLVEHNRVKSCPLCEQSRSSANKKPSKSAKKRNNCD